MFDDDEDSFKVGAGEIFGLFPFMMSFPFDYYEFELEKHALASENSVLDPIIVKAGGGFVEPHMVNFKYSSDYSDISLSFYTYDIRYIHEYSDKIKKMDALARMLTSAIESKDFIEKINAIKEGEKMLKKLGSGLTPTGTFDKILDQINDLSGSPINKRDLQVVRRLNLKIEQSQYSSEQQDVIRDFYNLHLHHVNIVLGVVIATKIHL